MTSSRLMSLMLLSGILSLSASTVEAQIISGVTGTTSMGTFNANYNIAHLTDGSGLSSYTPTAAHNAVFSNMWMSSSGVFTGSVTFDLQSVLMANTMYIWNYNFTSNTIRGVKTFNVSTSLDNVTFTPIGALANSSLTQGNGTSVTADTFNLGGVSARYIQIDILSNWGSTTATGLSEVMFDATAVPEASSLVLGGVVAGLGLTARARWRRSRSAA